jgi:nuclear pore complex protein Nup205
LFVENTLRLADELDYDEIETAKLLLEAEDDQEVLGRSHFECGIIRFHQQRKYLLDCIRLCINLANDDELSSDALDFFGAFVASTVYGSGLPGQVVNTAGQKIIPRCVSSMQDIKIWLQKIAEKVATTDLMYQNKPPVSVEFREAVEFSRVSLVQQHELLAVIMSSAVEKHQAGVKDFEDFIKLLKKADKYDHLLGKSQILVYMPSLA